MLSSLLPTNSLITALVTTVLLLIYGLYIHRLSRKHKSTIPISVNYHFSRKCNYECGFCLHTEKTSYILSLPNAKKGMKLLKEAGMQKLNFAGGEPFLYPSFLAQLLRYGKEVLKLESMSIVSNGSKITEKFLRENAEFIDILAISCDSFHPETNIGIGRGTKGRNVEQLRKIAGWCGEFGIKFKINTVVCHLNWDEDMTALIREVRPFRWKVFQCLLVAGENDNEQRKRDARAFLVSDEQWKVFCDRHKVLDCFVPESNDMMRSSYLILDEYMRFLSRSEGGQAMSQSILDVGVKKAMDQVTWDQNAFVERGGIYDWSSKGQGDGCGGGGSGGKDLGW